jgi:hypothetical protein
MGKAAAQAYFPTFMMLAVLSSSQAAENPNVAFAIQGRDVWARVYRDPYGRAEAMVMHLVRFALAHPQQNAVMGRLGGGVDDAAGSGKDPHELASSRRHGDNVTTLWPNWVYAGQPGTSPPIDMLARVFQREMESWHNRAQTVFWAGQHGSWGDVRHQYMACARATPSRLSYYVTGEFEYKSDHYKEEHSVVGGPPLRRRREAPRA